MYILYTADAPFDKKTTVAMFADDTAILATHTNYSTATANLQSANDKFSEWTKRWKIRINNSKSKKVDFALRPHPINHITLGNENVPISTHVRYLGFYLDQKLTWRTHIEQKT